MARNRQIEFDDLPGSIREALPSGDAGDTAWHPGITLSQMVADLEKKVLTRALEKGRTQVNAAKMLGINQSTIARKIKKYGLDRP
jgi:DNA-binding NtrC family response regulator